MPNSVLMPRPLTASGISQLEARLPVVKLWEAADPEATLNAVAQDIRSIAVVGHGAIDGALMGRLPNLQLVANFGVGYDAVDTAWAAQHGVIVTHTPNVLNEEVADTTLGLILNTVRELPAAERHVRAGQWLDKPFRLTSSLRERTVGILGLGRIGKAIATRCEAFGLPVVYTGRSAQAGVPYLFYPTLVGMAEACDILVVIAPGGAATRNIVDAAVLKALGPNGILINVARGSLVDEAALIEALQNHTILAAGLDVFADEPRVSQALLDLENVVLLPHVGSASQHTRKAMEQLVVDNILSWDSGKGPLTPVPETPWSPNKG
ncbi:2-hydroxyacid dehydrogenase [Lichenihabitans psoromatis]|uniref:2-hydroxyacid dehydrogenase n=1 Tax=Lichenihabitans psoromatis TaxID=2528642 RepID=UPI001036F320|nr:2-hydroxyacid dehydrogenase [Lichenihabitans psoromatis]